jgi:cell division protein FtsL
LLFCGLVLAGGFVFAAKQHFAAVQFGYQNESLRSERKRLLEENQRLALEKEKATAPDKLEPAARRLGLQPARPGQIARLAAEQNFAQRRKDAKEDAKGR